MTSSFIYFCIFRNYTRNQGLKADRMVSNYCVYETLYRNTSPTIESSGSYNSNSFYNYYTYCGEL